MPPSFTERFNDVFPYYFSIGMPSCEFWEGDPWLVRLYREAHKLKNEQRNQELWLQGLYFHDAVSVVLSNAFKKPGQRPEKYHEKPIRLTPLTEKEKKQIEIRRASNIINDFDAWGNKLNAHK